MEIKIIDAAHASDINLKNEPFPLRGRMKITRTEDQWHHEEELLPPDAITEMTFPDENYVFSEMKQYLFLGAYEAGQCVGLAILCPVFHPCLFLYDLKVKGDVRKHGIGRALIDKAVELAKAKGYTGIYTTGQDNNLNACLFYLACGFEIGGLDTAIYDGTKQAGKFDILFYKR